MKRMRYSVILAVCLSIITASPIVAIASGGLGGRPANPDPNSERTKSIFIYNLNAGDKKQDKLLVSNTTDSAATIQIYAVDAILTPTGDMTCEQEVESRDNVGSWVSLAKNELTLASQSSEVVDFTVQMPAKADVGEHNGCLIIQRKTTQTENTGGVQLQTRQAVRVAVIVPGDIHRDVTVDSFAVNNTGAKQTYKVAIKNSGNVSADTKITLRVKDMFGNTIYENGGTYATMADSIRSFNYESAINPWYGGYHTAELTLQYDKRAGTFGTKDESQLITIQADSVKFFTWPALWAIIAAILLLIAIVILIIVKRRKKRRHHRAKKSRSGLSIK
jgi:hypothetical protein